MPATSHAADSAKIHSCLISGELVAQCFPLLHIQIKNTLLFSTTKRSVLRVRFGSVYAVTEGQLGGGAGWGFN